MTHQPTEDEKMTTQIDPADPPTYTILVNGVFRDLRSRNGRTRTLRVDRLVDPDDPDAAITFCHPWSAGELRASCTVIRVDHTDGSVTEPQRQTTEVAAKRLLLAFESLTVDAFTVPFDWKDRTLESDAEHHRMDLLLTHRPCGQSIPAVFRLHRVDEPCPVAAVRAEHQQSCHGFVCRWCKTIILPETPTREILCEACRPASTCTTCCGLARYPDDILRLHAAHTETAATA